MKNTLKQKNILITGISGFIGSHLARSLRALGANVFGISRTASFEGVIKGDILNFSLVDEYMKKNKIDICFHLAGEVLVEAGQVDPYSTFKINMDGTLNILESTRRNKLERVIIASTAHVYGNSKLPYRETYTPKPSRPYETSKACADLIAQSYADTFDLPVLIPRFVNIYGPGDTNFVRLIPKTIKNVFLNRPVEMWGGDAERSYLYIDDAISAYVALASFDIKKIDRNRIFNFGSKDRIKVEDIINLIVSISKKKSPIVKIALQRDAEIKSQYVSWGKAKKMLNWKPEVTLNEGIARTIEWYEKNL